MTNLIKKKEKCLCEGKPSTDYEFRSTWDCPQCKKEWILIYNIYNRNKLEWHDIESIALYY